jgi:hypothetical protein
MSLSEHACSAPRCSEITGLARADLLMRGGRNPPGRGLLPDDRGLAFFVSLRQQQAGFRAGRPDHGLVELKAGRA